MSNLDKQFFVLIIMHKNICVHTTCEHKWNRINTLFSQLIRDEFTETIRDSEWNTIPFVIGLEETTVTLKRTWLLVIRSLLAWTVIFFNPSGIFMFTMSTDWISCPTGNVIFSSNVDLWPSNEILKKAQI